MATSLLGMLITGHTKRPLALAPLHRAYQVLAMTTSPDSSIVLVVGILIIFHK